MSTNELDEFRYLEIDFSIRIVLITFEYINHLIKSYHSLQVDCIE